MELNTGFDTLEEANEWGYMPHTIERKDGSTFTLNDDNVTYSQEFFKSNFPDNIHHKYEYEALTDPAHFKTIGWINIKNLKDKEENGK